MDVEKKYSSSYEKLIMPKIKIFLKKFFLVFLLFGFQTNTINAITPYYFIPTNKSLKKNSLEIGKKAYQLLYFRQLEEGLSLSKLAVALNKNDEKLWALLAEAQIANKLYLEALDSLSKGKNINPQMVELYFAEGSIYLKQKQYKNAKISLVNGLKIQPKNTNAIFQLGNIFFIEKEYNKALDYFNSIIKIESDFWQAINNKGLIYFELGNKVLAISNFNQAISIKDDAEPLLALAVSFQYKNLNESIRLAKKALLKNPNYVDAEFRKEQLWGDLIQKETKKLLEINELKEAVKKANLHKS